MLFKLFSRYISRKKAVIIVIFILWIYALMTGFSPSVIRAVFMFSVLALAQIMGRSYNPINTLFFTAFVNIFFVQHIVNTVVCFKTIVNTMFFEQLLAV
jgi:ComEC/Rec2-related protein